MNELPTLFSQHIARLREMGVTGEIMITPMYLTCDAPPNRNWHWALYVHDKLIHGKKTWAEVEVEVLRILSGARTKLVDDSKPQKGEHDRTV